MTSISQSRTIVVVERERELRDEAKEAFEAAGLRVLAFDDGQSALDYLGKHKDDVEAVFANVDTTEGTAGTTLLNAIGQVLPYVALIATAGVRMDRPEALDPQVRFFPRPWNSLDIVNAMQDIVLDQ